MRVVRRAPPAPHAKTCSLWKHKPMADDTVYTISVHEGSAKSWAIGRIEMLGSNTLNELAAVLCESMLPKAGRPDDCGIDEHMWKFEVRRGVLRSSAPIVEKTRHTHPSLPPHRCAAASGSATRGNLEARRVRRA